MLKLLKQEDCAILLVSELASSPNRVVSLTEIGKIHGVSLLFLKKLARNLKIAGIIESKEGAKGGYMLSREAKLISVLDVMEAVQEKYPWRKMSVRADCPLAATCLPQKIRKTLVDRIEKSLHTLSLYDLTHS